MCYDRRKGGCRTDGSMSEGLDVSSLSTSTAVVGASKDNVGPVCWRAQKAGLLDCSKLAAIDFTGHFVEKWRLTAIQQDVIPTIEAYVDTGH